MIFRYSYAASAGNSGIVIFEIKKALKNVKNNDFRAKKCYFHYKKRKSIAEIVSTMELFLVAEMGFEPHDLRVMSPTSYQTAPLRDIMVPEAGVEPVREINLTGF